MPLRTILPWVCLLVFVCHSASAQPLQVAPNGRHLQHVDGAPFFYLGDTAWELFHRLDREEARRYLTDRAEKGFTVIQAVVLAQLGGLDDPNPYGEVPLVDRDPASPNEAYFEHVDFVVDLADSLGLVMGMLPTWGSYWSSNNPDDVIFDEENARSYGAYLGERYLGRPVIWILGGDHNIHTDGERRLIEAMAAGLEAGGQNRHLITFHPRGPGLSSDYFHDAPWLDFNMFQSSHGGHDHDNGLFAEHDYALTPVKPTLDGEPRYETIPVGFYFSEMNDMDRFDAYDVRQAAYWSIFAGACGHTYGHNSVWQMWSEEHEPVLGATYPWHEALDHPGAFQMGVLKRFFTSLPFDRLVPAPETILEGPAGRGARVRVLVSDDRTLLLAYSPRGLSFTLDRSALSGRRVRESWFNPRYGGTFHSHTGDTKAMQTYTPPTSGRGQDWVLVLEGL